MAGTDRTRLRAGELRRAKTQAIDKLAADPAAAPVVILVDPQLGENVGMVARAMLNCELTRLRIVRPRKSWPSDKAIRASSGAEVVLEKAEVFDTTEEAIADLHRVYAATARSRDMTKQVVTPEQAAAEIRGAGLATGILFGGEAKGLHNDDVALADSILMAPLNPGFSSLNLAQAVLVVAYQWYRSGDPDAGEDMHLRGSRPATKKELVGFFEHLESALDDSGFLHVEEKRPSMVRNLRNVFQRAELTEQEIRTLRGVIKSLVIYGNSKRKG